MIIVLGNLHVQNMRLNGALPVEVKGARSENKVFASGLHCKIDEQGVNIGYLQVLLPARRAPSTFLQGLENSSGCPAHQDTQVAYPKFTEFELGQEQGLQQDSELLCLTVRRLDGAELCLPMLSIRVREWRHSCVGGAACVGAKA